METKRVKIGLSVDPLTPRRIDELRWSLRPVISRSALLDRLMKAILSDPDLLSKLLVKGVLEGEK